MAQDGTPTVIQFEGLATLRLQAFQLLAFGLLNSLEDGRPGFISDEYLNAISAETTIAADELEADGLWGRRSDAYNVFQESLLSTLIAPSQDHARFS